MTKWLDKFTPDDYVSSVYDIDLDKLWNAGKRLILTDLDNTLVPWNVPDCPSALVDWLAQVKQRGFDVCIVSNNQGARVEAFSKLTGIYSVSAARKPQPDGLKRAMDHFHRQAMETVMVGDQIFTDVQSAARAGVYSILVLPIHPREWWLTQLVRRVERIVLWQLVRQGRVIRPRRD